jgi:hypothetical protein
VCWSALAISHVITFVCSSIFIGLWLLLLPGRPRKRLSRLARVGGAYVLGVSLSLFFLAPAYLADYLVIRDFAVPFGGRAFTPLYTLLSPTSLPPVPRVGYTLTENVHPAVGWPILLGAAAALYSLVAQPGLICRRGAPPIMWSLLSVFILALFAAWSPVDFWSLLPRQLHVVQFPFRLLTQVTWAGALLAAYGLYVVLRGRLDQRHVTIGVLVIGIAVSSWLPSPRPNDKTLADFVREPELEVGRADYLVAEQSPWFGVSVGGLELPFVDIATRDGRLNQDREVDISSLMRYRSRPLTMRVVGDVAAQPPGHTVVLSVLLEGESIASTQLSPGPFTWEVPLRRGVRAVSRSGNNDTVGLRLVTERMVPSQDGAGPNPSGERAIVHLHSATIAGLPAERAALPVNSTRNDCVRAALETTCEVSVSEYTGLVQVPVLFYPGLLVADLDGQARPYVPLPHRSFVLVGLQTPPGEHRISVRFEGLSWANRISLLAWLSVALLFVVSFSRLSRLFRSSMRQRPRAAAGLRFGRRAQEQIR